MMLSESPEMGVVEIVCQDFGFVRLDSGELLFFSQFRTRAVILDCEARPTYAGKGSTKFQRQLEKRERILIFRGVDSIGRERAHLQVRLDDWCNIRDAGVLLRHGGIAA